MKLSMIVAMTNNNVIGLNNEMPWHLPADFKWYKKSTMGKPLIMGRKTYESIGRPLPGRLNIVLSRDSDFCIEGCLTANSLENALSLVERDEKSHEEVFINGGAHLYREYLSDIDSLYLTIINAELKGDTFFPDYTQYNWQEIHRSEHPADDKNAYDLTFLKLERVRTEA